MCVYDNCVGSVANMIVSITSMLSSLFPAGSVRAPATRMIRAGSKAAMKAALKDFAKSIDENSAVDCLLLTK